MRDAVPRSANATAPMQDVTKDCDALAHLPCCAGLSGVPLSPIVLKKTAHGERGDRCLVSIRSPEGRA